MNNTRFLARVGMLIGLILVIAACAQASPPPTSSTPTANTSRTTATSTAFSWQTLEQRPLHLLSLRPGTPCPTTHSKQAIPGFSDFLLGNGPVYADFFGGNAGDSEQSVLRYADAQTFGGGGTSGWGGQKVLWFINPAYRGPVLIRGGQLDGVHAVRFNGGPDHEGDPALLTELRLMGGGAGGPWPNWGTYTRLQVPGCYAYQVDGVGFSYIIIFQAIAEHNPPPKP